MSKPIVAKSIGLVGVRRGLFHPQFQTLCRMLVTQKGRGALAGVEVAHRSNDGWSGADFSRITRWMNTLPRMVLHESGRSDEESQPLAVESMASWAEFSIEQSAVPSWNREIVEESEVVISCPPIAEEEHRSRTWATVRYARSLSKIVIIIYPDGSVEVGGQQCFMVKESLAGEEMWVFLFRDPKSEGYAGVPARPVILETLPQDDRSQAVRPVLGKAKKGSNRFREFPNRRELRQAGFVEVGAYRVCDSWEDFHFPWETSTPTESDSHEMGDTNAETKNIQTNPQFNQPADSIPALELQHLLARVSAR